MLSRVAESLYWMSRYLERAEHTARLLDLNLHQMLDQSPISVETRWDRLLQCLSVKFKDEAPSLEAFEITRALTFDQTQDASILCCITRARENARQIREQISSEMWEQLNRLSLQIKRTGMEELWQSEPHEFFQAVKDGSHLFQGITEATMSRGEGWHFIQLGRYIERAQATAKLLDVHLTSLVERQRSEGAQLDFVEMVALLKSCTAFEAYCQFYTAYMQPSYIAEFLLLSAECPRSVRFAVEVVQVALKAIAKQTGINKSSRAERIAGRLRATLEFGQVDEIIADSLHEFLEDTQQLCTQVHNGILQTYISYPIDIALAS